MVLWVKVHRRINNEWPAAWRFINDRHSDYCETESVKFKVIYEFLSLLNVVALFTHWFYF